MRPVPSRPRTASFGFAPIDADLETRIATLKSMSTLAQATGDAQLQPGWENGIQSYADAVWAAVRVLQDAGRAQLSDAAPYDVTIKTLLDAFNPANPVTQAAFAFSRSDVARGQAGPGWVTWKPIGNLYGMVNRAEWTLVKGDARALETARKNKDAMLNRVMALRAQVHPGSTVTPGTEWRSMTANESIPAATERWRIEGPVPADATIVPGSAPGSAPESAPGSTPSVPTALPAWAIPTGLAIATLVGLGLLARTHAARTPAAWQERGA